MNVPCGMEYPNLIIQSFSNLCFMTSIYTEELLAEDRAPIRQSSSKCCQNTSKRRRSCFKLSLFNYNIIIERRVAVKNLRSDLVSKQLSDLFGYSHDSLLCKPPPYYLNCNRSTVIRLWVVFMLLVQLCFNEKGNLTFSLHHAIKLIQWLIIFDFLINTLIRK